MVTVIHVSLTGSDCAVGSENEPLRTISRAAECAQPGDTVLVHEGEYREWVSPRVGGLSDSRRITYCAAPDEHVVIKGSERITGWEREDGTVWKAVVPNTLFGTSNPYAQEIDGDWTVYPSADSPRKHLGDVYLNGRSFFEVHDRSDLDDPPRRESAIDGWTGVTDYFRDPEQTRFVWLATVSETETTIWANFHGADPNVELVEINVRPAVFYPRQHHVDYITVRGFELAHAASPWTPPTADQPGLVGPNWAKGWIIEDNIIHDAKCSAISIGKEASTGHNYATLRRDKPGYQYQLESVFSARQIGWDKEHIGSHIIRRNTIFDCGQNGIVGHLGCVFSTIEDNHIYNIALKREFFGHEIGGIKLHAAIDVAITHNRIHDCSLGIWLDWQTQGTRVSRNLLYENTRDLFVEVSHGPYVVDHNIFASAASLEVFSQGGAFLHNLIGGTLSLEQVIDRPTPYHVPHSTQVAGYASILGGDDRYVGNIFFSGALDRAYGPTAREGQVASYGTAEYDGHPATMTEFLATVADPTLGDHQRFRGVKQPVYLHHNVYLGGARAYEGEDSATVLSVGSVRIEQNNDEVFLVTDLPASFTDVPVPVIGGRDLPRVRFVDAEFEEPDGTPLVLGADLTGAVKSGSKAWPAGPLGTLGAGSMRTRVW